MIYTSLYHIFCPQRRKLVCNQLDLKMTWYIFTQIYAQGVALKTKLLRFYKFLRYWWKTNPHDDSLRTLTTTMKTHWKRKDEIQTISGRWHCSPHRMLYDAPSRRRGKWRYRQAFETGRRNWRKNLRIGCLLLLKVGEVKEERKGGRKTDRQLTGVQSWCTRVRWVVVAE